VESFDLIVIGGGPGGYPAAIRAAQLGASVALVEKDQLGGTCLNRGCIPTKTLIASAELAAHARRGEEMGVRIPEVSPDYPAMAARKDKVVERLRGGVGSLLKANGVKVLTGSASFVSPREVLVAGPEGETRLGADKVIIATGSAPAVPGFVPKDGPVYTSRTLLELTELPESIIVLGGGYIGCEFACLLALLGVKVTVVEMLEDILFLLDRDARSEIKRSMKKMGVEVLTGSPLEDITAGAEGVSGRTGEKQVEAAAMLVSVGRRPVTDGLKLEAIGLELDDKGFIPVDEGCRTSVPGVFAVGDVNGIIQLAHAATAQGLVAAENACGGRQLRNESLVPACIFTLPEVGAVGVSEAEAREKGLAVKRAKFPFMACGKALAAGESAGFVKLLADEATGRLLGAQAVGPHATDLIAEAAVAIRAELTAHELGATVHAHPTLAEVWMECAHVMEGRPVHSAPPRKPN
jgi:dihydrolipoamide dehydrogenase